MKSRDPAVHGKVRAELHRSSPDGRSDLPTSSLTAHGGPKPPCAVSIIVYTENEAPGRVGPRPAANMFVRSAGLPVPQSAGFSFSSLYTILLPSARLPVNTGKGFFPCRPDPIRASANLLLPQDVPTRSPSLTTSVGLPENRTLFCGWGGRGYTSDNCPEEETGRMIMVTFQ